MKFSPPVSELFTAEEVADRLNLEPCTIRNRASKRKIGIFFGDNRLRLFTPAQVEELRKATIRTYTPEEDALLITKLTEQYPPESTRVLSIRMNRSTQSITRRMNSLGYRWSRMYAFWEKTSW